MRREFSSNSRERYSIQILTAIADARSGAPPRCCAMVTAAITIAPRTRGCGKWQLKFHHAGRMAAGEAREQTGNARESPGAPAALAFA